mmetsp:Transcript_56722/g.164525  ORF Transcript_56722/g.164525 Transcript_56722/m.164525 type:complete len:87 (+) Transcript_56722:91-351(+)|eukprot:CAMPEP_0176053002 /NCGR_PEP_ID=MMETSP0120_2-20121206/26358_1 /TAXON_ID=160619 /ORGANISM="Kryptoperidinium foliaceum, Strain CCMP 1326" /LENGTH=86 /DNA_ID=CAMNT_0017386449 /DNA_START=51 /DNA_END=311 /DNA_ORIENTATION=+
MAGGDVAMAASGSPTSQGSCGPLKSALKLKSETSESRFDSQNKVIEKGGSHHMVFLDTHSPGTPVEEVREVAIVRNSSPSCGCVVS